MYRKRRQSPLLHKNLDSVSARESFAEMESSEVKAVPLQNKAQYHLCADRNPNQRGFFGEDAISSTNGAGEGSSFVPLSAYPAEAGISRRQPDGAVRTLGQRSTRETLLRAWQRG